MRGDDAGEWTPEKVDETVASGKSVLAKFVKPLPVYIVYFSSAALNDGKPGRTAGLDEEELALVRDMFLLTLKPVLYIANVTEDGFENNPHLDAVRKAPEWCRYRRRSRKNFRRWTTPTVTPSSPTWAWTSPA